MEYYACQMNKPYADAESVEQVPLAEAEPAVGDQSAPVQTETGGRRGLEPTRYGDWEKNGRCIDF